MVAVRALETSHGTDAVSARIAAAVLFAYVHGSGDCLEIDGCVHGHVPAACPNERWRAVNRG